MPASLLHLGERRPPGSARKRITWTIVTLVPLGAIAGLLAFGAIANWALRARGEVPAPDLGDTIWMTVLATLMRVTFVLSLVIGMVRVREDRAVERERARSSNMRTSRR
ncbi:hypothetical protein [Microbacterium halophytorum]|uniref:hypothetical protein n=1 Tax=Microbacterium halophytorum TaxID=2067568 RepID=UPI000CFDCFC4|nr:hypothetical protein [Microbacterium halophytorum]